jgi:hypothetical protein
MSEFNELAIIEAVFDTSKTDSSGASNKTVATHGLGIYIPSNAIITRAFYDVITTFTSANDSATIGLYAVQAGDLVAAIAISAANPGVWDAGVRGTLINSPAVPADATSAIITTAAYAATLLKTTATKELKVIVGVQALTAGKLRLYVEYYMTEVVV